MLRCSSRSCIGGASTDLRRFSQFFPARSRRPRRARPGLGSRRPTIPGPAPRSAVLSRGTRLAIWCVHAARQRDGPSPPRHAGPELVDDRCPRGARGRLRAAAPAPTRHATRPRGLAVRHLCHPRWRLGDGSGTLGHADIAHCLARPARGRRESRPGDGGGKLAADAARSDQCNRHVGRAHRRTRDRGGRQPAPPGTEVLAACAAGGFSLFLAVLLLVLPYTSEPRVVGALGTYGLVFGIALLAAAASLRRAAAPR